MSAVEAFWVFICLATIAMALWWNRHLLRIGGTTRAELAYYALALAGLVFGWIFNFQYLREYGAQAGWWHWTTLLFANPASASAAQDLIIANVPLFVLWTMVDGRRDGVRAWWWFFPMSVFTSFAFAMGLFLGLRERQLRWNASGTRT